MKQYLIVEGDDTLAARECDSLAEATAWARQLVERSDLEVEVYILSLVRIVRPSRGAVICDIGAPSTPVGSIIDAQS